MSDLSFDHFSGPTNFVRGPASAPSGQAAQSVLLKRQQAVLALGRRAAASSDLSAITQDAAQLMADMLETEYGAVAQWSAGDPSITLRLLKRTGDGQGAMQSLEIPAGENSLVRYTAGVREPVVVNALGEEQRFQDPLLRRLKVRSAVSVPLAANDSTFGVLAACSLSGRTFAPEDVSFAENVGHLLTTNITRQQAEALLNIQRRAADVVLDTIDALVLILDPQGRVQTINRAGQSATGFTAENLRGRPIWSVFCSSQEAPGMQYTLGRLDKEAGPVGYESFLITKHGQRRRIAWTCGTVRDDRGQLSSIIATGIDVTDRIIAELDPQSPDASANPSSGGLALNARGADRRTQPRKPYPYQQLIAPLVGGELPNPKSFSPVTCHDISPGGFSFVSTTAPQSNEYVVALGRGESLTYLIAQIAHMTRFEQNGKRKYLIGCNYVGRADY